MIFPAVAGTLIVVVILWEAFETIVLPRRVVRLFRFTVLFYRATWIPWRATARSIHKPRLRETFLSIYGPLSLLFLMIAWAVLLIGGFGLIYFSVAAPGTPTASLQTSFYFSGTTFLTLGLGDVTPHKTVERVLAVTECGLGFGFLALILSYLPVIYSAFSRREVSIVLLDARAGSPPTAAELLRRHAGVDGLAALEILLHDWERWSAEILESHVSYPVLSYFRSQHNNESWLAALAAILDTTALLVAKTENVSSRQARLTFAMCRHTVVDLAQVFHAVPRDGYTDRLPPSDLQRMTQMLTKTGLAFIDSADTNAKLAKMRQMYEPYLFALSRHLYMDVPPWILAKEISDNWRTSAWGRITGFSAVPSREDLLDDHNS